MRIWLQHVRRCGGVLRLWRVHIGEFGCADGGVVVVVAKERSGIELIALGSRWEEGEVPAGVEVGGQEVLCEAGLALGDIGLGVGLVGVEGARVGDALVGKDLRL